MRDGFGLKKTKFGWHIFIVHNEEVIMSGIKEYGDKRQAITALTEIADTVEDCSVEDAEAILVFINEFDSSGVFVDEIVRERVNKDSK